MLQGQEWWQPHAACALSLDKLRSSLQHAMSCTLDFLHQGFSCLTLAENCMPCFKGQQGICTGLDQHCRCTGLVRCFRRGRMTQQKRDNSATYPEPELYHICSLYTPTQHLRQQQCMSTMHTDTKLRESTSKFGQFISQLTRSGLAAGCPV